MPLKAARDSSIDWGLLCTGKTMLHKASLRHTQSYPVLIFLRSPEGRTQPSDRCQSLVNIGLETVGRLETTQEIAELS